MKLPASLARSFLARFRRDDRGASAVEFVLILPSMILLTIGVINLSVLLYTVSTLHFAAETAARYCMIHSCTAASLSTYASSQYLGMGSAPTFTQATATCGEQVTGAASFTFVTGLANITVPLSATACHPLA